jgi:tyrosyl-tRNA synthetase
MKYMAKIITDENKIDEALTRGVENIYPNRGALKKVLLSGKKIRLYCGYDPSAPALHIGNAISLMKLGQFQALGHEVIFLIGDFTGMIGDPTDKTVARKKLTRKEVLANAKNYKKQASAYIKFSGANSAKIMHNSQWHDKLSFRDLIEVASNFTAQQMFARDMFQKRIKADKPIYLHEFLYPLAQGYDSVVMEVDLEIGGNDQTFNMLCGRDLMKALKNKEKFVLTAKLLVDQAGKKMGKTEGNMINLDEKAEDMYGKIMSWPDELIGSGFELCTNVLMEEVEKIKKELAENKVNPRDYKMKLAYEVVKIYHGEEAAQIAQENFINTFSKKQTPSDVRVTPSPAPSISIIDYIIETGLATSKSDARRKIEQGGVYVDGKRVESVDLMLNSESDHGKIIKVGKRNFVKIVF